MFYGRYVFYSETFKLQISSINIHNFSSSLFRSLETCPSRSCYLYFPIFERKMIFERMLIERKFLSICKGYFLFNFLSKLPFFRKKSYLKECTKTVLFERTAFKRKKLILKEHYSINRPRPLQISRYYQSCLLHKTHSFYVKW
jgi:hypothetical protein